MMKLSLILVVVSAFAATASAQTGGCRTIESNSERLACYDKASPPLHARSSSESKSLSQARGAMAKGSKDADGRPADGQDFLAAENARLDAMLKNICRGC